ncbi:hypothetical protein C816_04150 [Oscillibacter sp. 1-3]|nr:hypothetical protein C816_04150 [Oscillibacter sp. 1-3]
MAAERTSRMVTIYTQAYNTKPYLEQCISSVLSQTYTNFEYILVDNGCTDGSSELMDAFAARDPRIRLIHYRENQLPRPLRFELAREYAAGAYYAVIDSDDWWDPDYLERLVGFLEENDLDIALTGTASYLEASGRSYILRKLDQRLVLTRAQFAQYYPQVWTFPSTFWGSVIKTGLFQALEYADIAERNYPYGTDTMFMLRYIDSCGRIGIDNSALYHYRIRPSSISSKYSPLRFDGNIAYYEIIESFLKRYQALDSTKQEWLKNVHLHSMAETLEALERSSLSVGEKMRECARITSHPLTPMALTYRDPIRDKWYDLVRSITRQALTGGASAADICAVLKVISPRCCAAAQTECLDLFSREAGLQAALLKDDWDSLSGGIMELIVQRKYTKQYSLGELIHSLAPENSPLRETEDTRYFREYAEICLFILCKNYPAALDRMTERLLRDEPLYRKEFFLQVYLSVSALAGHPEAFVYGKFQMAWLLLEEKRAAECRVLVEELEDMGTSAGEELSELRRKLDMI